MWTNYAVDRSTDNQSESLVPRLSDFYSMIAFNGGDDGLAAIGVLFLVVLQLLLRL